MKQNVILDPISTIGSVQIAPFIEALQTDWSKTFSALWLYGTTPYVQPASNYCAKARKVRFTT